MGVCMTSVGVCMTYGMCMTGVGGVFMKCVVMHDVCGSGNEV